jgi:hypothetical protein
LQISRRRAPGVFTNECFPLGAPLRSAAERAHCGRRDGMLLVIHVQAGAPDESQAPVIEIIIRPFIDHDALCDGSVPDVDIEGKQRGQCALPVSEMMLPDLTVIIRQAVGKRLGFGEQ